MAASAMTVRVIEGDCRDSMRALIAEGVRVQTIVTSPPYFGLRDYGHAGQIGLETSPVEFIAKLVDVFEVARELLADDGTLWLNMGDSYAGSWGAQSRPQSCPICHEDEARTGTCSGSFDPRALCASVSAAQIASAPRRVQTGTIRMGGIKPKDLYGIPYRLAFELQDAGWYWRSNIVWAKPNAMPGSQEDRCTSSHEAVLMFSKSRSYFSDFDAIKTPPRESSQVRLAQDTQAQSGSHRANGGGKTNGPMKAVGSTDKQRGHSRRHAGFDDRWDHMTLAEQSAAPAMMRDVWFIPTVSYREAHFAVMPEELARRCILAGSRTDDIVLDPFGGAGTTGLVADRHGRNAILCELNPDYAAMARRRIYDDAPLFAAVA